jgi:hypothetical protein
VRFDVLTVVNMKNIIPEMWVHAVWYKFMDFSEDVTTFIFRVENYVKKSNSILLKTEAVLFSESFINFYQTKRSHIPEDRIL